MTSVQKKVFIGRYPLLRPFTLIVDFLRFRVGTDKPKDNEENELISNKGHHNGIGNGTSETACKWFIHRICEKAFDKFEKSKYLHVELLTTGHSIFCPVLCP